ncbi:uncharacterized protein [Epargyreus clarus]|uniref:uncharacterized protein isoform X2 n=1 Tax=Epargyreus clarus TaxID=520877 RepID=UPI003C2D4CEC
MSSNNQILLQFVVFLFFIEMGTAQKEIYYPYEVEHVESETFNITFDLAYLPDAPFIGKYRGKWYFSLYRDSDEKHPYVPNYIIKKHTWEPIVILTSPTKNTIEFHDGDTIELQCMGVNLHRYGRLVFSGKGDIATYNGDIYAMNLTLNRNYDGIELRCIGRSLVDGSYKDVHTSQRKVLLKYINEPKVTIRTHPSERSGRIYSAVGNEITIWCNCYLCPEDTKIVMYEEDKFGNHPVLKNDTNTKIKIKLQLKESHNNSKFYCSAHFYIKKNNASTTDCKQSQSVTVVLAYTTPKEKPKKTILKNITEYRKGDRFNGTCTDSNQEKYYSWIITNEYHTRKSLNSSLGYAVLDIELADFYNNWILKCVATDYSTSNYLSAYDQISSTKLILKENEKTILNNITEYRNGDQFNGKCTDSNQKKYYSWVKSKGLKTETLNSTLGSAVLDIKLTDSYNNWTLNCISSDHIMLDFVYKYEIISSTKLILILDAIQTQVKEETHMYQHIGYWYILAIVLLVLIIISVCIYVCVIGWARNKKKLKTNEIVSDKAKTMARNNTNCDVVYAQLTLSEPTRPILDERLEYAQICGYLKPNVCTKCTLDKKCKKHRTK